MRFRNIVLVLLTIFALPVFAGDGQNIIDPIRKGAIGYLGLASGNDVYIMDDPSSHGGPVLCTLIPETEYQFPAEYRQNIDHGGRTLDPEVGERMLRELTRRLVLIYVEVPTNDRSNGGKKYGRYCKRLVVYELDWAE